jgi:cation/acetate symporter
MPEIERDTGMNLSPSFLAFLVFVILTLAITYWSSKRTSGQAAFFAAGRRLTGWQNGFALAGDILSAAAFLGWVGLIALQGFDGFLYPISIFIAYLCLMLVIGEPLRNTGKFTVADVLASRHRPRPVQAVTAISTLIICTLYMVAQMVGAGALVSLLLRDSGVTFREAVVGVGILMMVYVVFGGMLATTWVQIVKAVLLMTGTIAMTFFVFAHYDFSLPSLFRAASHVSYHARGRPLVSDFLRPGLLYRPPYGSLDVLSLGLALIFGISGLPHVLVRLYTVPDARVVRQSLTWCMSLVGSFCLMVAILGLGAATILGPDFIVTHGGTNMSGPLLAQNLGGNIFFAFISTVSFATILAVIAGLTISASTSFAHDFWINVLFNGVERPGQKLLVARMSALVLGGISIYIASELGPGANVAFLATLVMAIAASSNFPVLLLTLYWRRFNTAGVLSGVIVGLTASIGLILASPYFMGIDPPNVAAQARHLIQAKSLFPLENPGIVSIPLGFLGAVVGTLLSRERTPDTKFNELLVSSNTGLGAEAATAD